MSSLQILEPLRRRSVLAPLNSSSASVKLADNDNTNRWQLIHYSNKSPHFHDYDVSLSDFSSLTNNRNPNLDNNDHAMVNNHNKHSESALQLTSTSPSTTTGHKLKHYDHLAQLSCDSGEMILRLNFTEPFKGIVYPDHNRVSACRFFGDGHHNYELRLPLRGCGTRQAAPRVFVNDVIVRFHKTLELEEDEVKTLICRYPPPSAQAGEPGSIKSGQAEYGSSTGSSPSSPTAPFELVELAATGNERTPSHVESTLDTQSENLLVAPSSSNRVSPQLSSASIDFRQRGPGISSSPDQRGSNLILASGHDQQLQRQGQSAGFFERLSSVELLFMISSLMFLVLLAVGLAASYLCFRRQSRRRGVDRRASAILRRKRHYPAQSVGPMQAAPPSSYLDRMLPSSLRPDTRYMSPAYLVAGAAPASSSPESELSHSGLLAAPTSQAYFYSNRAFAPDLAGVKQATYLAPIGITSSTGRRDSNQYTSYGQPTISRACRHLAPERAPLPVPPAPPVKQRHLVASRGHQYTPAGYAVASSKYKVPEVNYTDYQSRALLENGRPLWRAKSMSKASSMKHRESSGQHEASAATLSRQRPRSYVPERLWSTEANNNNYQDEEPPNKRPPKLYLKSIEDSYITKLTEIHEQEFMKRDNTRPLSMAEWRKISVNSRKPTDLGSQSVSVSASSAESSSGSLGNVVVSDDISGQQRMFNSTGRSNLRSLTELDVNFARSLLRPANRKSPAPSLRAARSLDRLASRPREFSSGRSSRPASESRDRSNSDPEVRCEQRSSSPDLILSPDYEHARLELAGPTPGNTVSYV